MPLSRASVSRQRNDVIMRRIVTCCVINVKRYQVAGLAEVAKFRMLLKRATGCNGLFVQLATI